MKQPKYGESFRDSGHCTGKPADATQPSASGDAAVGTHRNDARIVPGSSGVSAGEGPARQESADTDVDTGQVEAARRIAERAHAGQTDKAGRPYIEHPAYVAAHVQGARAKAAAWLHDVVEDTPVTLDDLRAAGMDPAVVEAVRLLTHDESVPYLDYIRALKGNPLARQVKLADLAHNSDLSRIPHPTERDYRRLEKYRRAREILEDVGGEQPNAVTAKG